MTSRSKRVQRELTALPQGQNIQCLLLLKQQLTCCIEDFTCFLSREQQGLEKSTYCFNENPDRKRASQHAELKSSLVVKMRKALVLCCGLTVQNALGTSVSKAMEM